MVGLAFKTATKSLHRVDVPPKCKLQEQKYLSNRGNLIVDLKSHKENEAPGRKNKNLSTRNTNRHFNKDLH